MTQPPLVGQPVSQVAIVDIDMPFGSMVIFMVKWAIATIPALFVLVIVGAMIVAFLATIGLGAF